MKTIMAGPDGSAMPGQIVTVDSGAGMSLIKGGYAELVERGPVPVETAMIEPPEKADIRPHGRRGKKS